MSNALIAQLAPSLVVSAALSAVLIYLNWQLFLVMIAVAPALWLVNRIVGRQVKNRYRAFRETFDAFSKGVLFLLQSIDLTRWQTAETEELSRQRETLERLRAASASMAWLDTAYALIQSYLATVSGILILLVGGRAVAYGQMSLGDLLAFYVTVALLQQSARTALTAAPQIMLGAESLAGIFELRESGEREPYRGSRKIAFTGRLAIESVHFGYGDRPVLRGVNLELEPGRTVAVIGPNGCGKTTVLYLAAGFYRPSAGRLLADGIPYDELDLRDLRRSIAVAPQAPGLFHGTIRENVVYGRTGVTDEDLLRAAQLSTAQEVIAGLELGWDTLVGDSGVRLSGGQQQRIALTRALLRRPRLLILDEPTNHLDGVSMARLLENLRRLPDAPAVLLISHDPEVVRCADMVYSICDGKTQLERATVRIAVAQ
jgi:ABC-type bacteriocin/lantibiotic exporter with double-glycine peptidase domain